MRLVTGSNPRWPKLSWVARCDDESIEVIHGPGVETGEDWAFEGAWTGDFRSADFDLCGVVAGSGVRVRRAEAHFVPPTSTVDRLISGTSNGATYISNSLLALTAISGAEITDAKMPSTVASISRGLDRCAKSIESSIGPLDFHYFHNLIWDGQELREQSKPPWDGDASGFAVYRESLSQAFARLAENMADPARNRALRFVGTLSSGYDANASTALARAAGCHKALCFETTGSGHPDSGIPVAESLGIEPVLLDRDSWRGKTVDGIPAEVPFLAVGQGSGLVSFAAAQDHLDGAVLVTGFYGDSIWNPDWKHLGPEIVRKDASGLGFCEYRLNAGFVNCSPAFWAARQVSEVVALSRSEEMKVWNTGSDYGRPIPRRILQEAGVPGDLFGRAKRGVPKAQPHRDRRFLSRSAQRDYFDWVSRNASHLGRMQAPAAVQQVLDRAEFERRDLVLRAHVGAEKMLRRSDSPRWRSRRQRLRSRRRSPTPRRRFVLQWALERGRRPFS